MSTAVKRACDACHRRKVKCDGINPCRNCSSAQLTCTYNAIPQKKGPKGSRAKVISELRQTQNLSTKPSQGVRGGGSGAGLGGPMAPSQIQIPNLLPSPGLLTREMVRDSIDFFFTHMYPQMPILQRQRLEQQALYADQSLDTYCLLTSLCAFMMFQPGMPCPPTMGAGDDMFESNSIVMGTLLLEETLRVRKGYDYMDSPSLNTLCTSFFLYACYNTLELHNKAWYHIREAATFIHMGALNKEETYLRFDNVEASRRRRLYWLLLVTER